MKLKNKLLLSIVSLLFIIFTIGTTSKAFTVSPPPFPNDWGDGWTLYCREKGGAFRVGSPNDVKPWHEYAGKYCENKNSGQEQMGIAANLIYRQLIAQMKEIADTCKGEANGQGYDGTFPKDGSITLQDGEWCGVVIATNPNYNISSQTTEKNLTYTYIMSAGEEGSPLADGHEQGNYIKEGTVSDKASTDDKQEAIWNDPTINSGKMHSGSALYQEAVDYKSFIETNNITNKYDAKFNKTTKAQVIANRSAKQYIVGPFVMIYPDDDRFSYIENMWVVSKNGTKYKLDTAKDIIFANKGTRVYPASGEQFYIQFTAGNIGNVASVDLEVQFTYLAETSADIKWLEGTGELWQCRGKTIFQKNRHEEGHYETDRDRPEYDDMDYNHEHPYYPHQKWVDTSHNDVTVSGSIYLKKIGTYNAQKLAIGKGDRIWKSSYLTYGINLPTETPPTSTPPDKQIPLTIELGGRVWVDSASGKESVGNNTYGSEDIPMSGVPVYLYSAGGSLIASTTTDGNGEYKFTNLDAMQQYYVKFKYNSQYYEPVEYAPPYSGANSSNGTDVRGERQEVNARFASIGSTPANYTGKNGLNKTYTREELKAAGVIDEFGNLKGGDSSMRQFVEDCQLESITGNGGIDLYPVENSFVIDNHQYPSILVPKVPVLYDKMHHINQGYKLRQESDLAIKKDVDKVTLEINGQKHEYTYDTLENKENAEKQWDIGVRLSDSYYNTKYSRELYKSDYIYKSSMYGDKDENKDQIGDVFGKSKKDELEVFVTYKIMVRNQALSIQAKINEIVDYYDTDYEYIDERSYIQIKAGENKGIYNTKASGTSRYEQTSSATRTKLDGYNNVYLTGLDDKYLTAGQTAYFYLTFKVKKDTLDGEDWVRLDEELVSGTPIGVGKENIVEINGYSTRYANGTTVPNVGDVSNQAAGIVDRDSNPGNLNPSDVPKDGNIKYNNFEDDTDKAPNIRIVLYRNDDATRVISGSVWEDERTKNIEATTTGDGIRADKETLINGVTVQLVELMDNGTEYVWREFGAEPTNLGGEIGGVNTIGKGTGTGTVDTETPIINYKDLIENYKFENKHDGAYAFKSFMPGKYVVRFIYGDTIRTVTPKGLNVGGLNNKSYNGQDYKSTTYQEGITQNKTYTWRENSTWNKGQETLGKVIREISTYNKETCNKNETLSYLYDITASDKINNVSDAKDIESRRNQVIDYSDDNVTNYIAEVLASHKTDYAPMNDRTQLLNDLMANTKMVSETGLMVIELEYDRAGTGGQVENNTASYKITNVDLGLEERAKAGLAINKEVTNVKLTLADGSILFDAKDSATNVLWKDHKLYKVGYKGNFMDPDKFGNIENIRNNNASKIGLIQLTMDEELMHGATIQITYQITVSNVGEVDYKDNCFYYTGNVKDKSTVVKTSANQILDYVANNLQFYEKDNSDWKVISKEDIIKVDNKVQNLVNENLKSKLEQFNTIIVTEKLSEALVPNLYKEKVDKNAKDSVSVPLVLTQLITAENDTDDLTYKNIVEIVKTSNNVGRRNEYSVVGNQDPTKDPQELDSDKAEIIRILPPFGNAGIYMLIATITLAAVGIVVVGIIFIKKKVLKK